MKRGSPLTISTKIPSSLNLSYLPVNGASVALFCVTLNSISDNLYGWLEYKTGNTEIETTYPFKNMILPYYYDNDSMTVNQRSLRLKLQQCNNSCSVLNGTIFDHLQSNEIHIVTATLNNNKTEMLWKQRHREGYGMGTGATGMTLPREFLLIKQ